MSLNFFHFVFDLKSKLKFKTMKANFFLRIREIVAKTRNIIFFSNVVTNSYILRIKNEGGASSHYALEDRIEVAQMFLSLGQKKRSSFQESKC